MVLRKPSPTGHSSDPQPKSIKLTWKALLTFPYRMCNPPPAVGNVRSCQVTPVVNVKLDDVLNRTHLPPLGLKDFEEWLLFVEQCPENLYFLLWLKEYTTRYDQWVTSTKPFPNKPSPFSSAQKYRAPNVSGWPKTNPSLAVFYARAKETFFTPNSVYELNLPSEILGPFHAPVPDHPFNSDFNGTPQFGAFSPHPDPAVFNEVAYEIRGMLEESLDRFVKATFNNVGTGRALCGLIGGIVIALLGTVPPIAQNFATGRDRWMRLFALPGLWLGLTVALASLHGVCMMIYVFGDLRQLRSFELSRPPISPPKPFRNDTSWFRTPPRQHVTTPVPVSPAGNVPFLGPPISIPKSVYTSPSPPRIVLSIPPQQSPTKSAPISPISPTVVEYQDRCTSTNSLIVNTPRLTYPSSSSIGSSSQHTTSSSDGAHAIHISEAYYDEHPGYPGEPVSSPVPSSWNSPSPEPVQVRAPVIWESVAHPVPDHRVSTSFDRVRGGPVPSLAADSDIWTSTASFIHPYEYSRWDEDFRYDAGDEESHHGHSVRIHDNGRRAISSTRPRTMSIGRVSALIMARERQPVDAFDFDALPAVRAHHAGRPRYKKCDASPPPMNSEKESRKGVGIGKLLLAPKELVRRFQGGCDAVKGVLQTVLNKSADSNRRFSQYHDDEQEKSENEKLPVDPASRFKKVLKVPAFQSPLTKILSPVVTRAQWEIVVRSAIFSLFISWGLLAGLLAAPVIR